MPLNIESVRLAVVGGVVELKKNSGGWFAVFEPTEIKHTGSSITEAAQNLVAGLKGRTRDVEYAIEQFLAKNSDNRERS